MERQGASFWRRQTIDRTGHKGPRTTNLRREHNARSIKRKAGILVG